MDFVYDDGGRSNYFKGKAGDCVCRAIAIATEGDYKYIYDLINMYAGKEKITKKKKDKSQARNGVYKNTTRKIIEDFFGWTWHPCMKIGTGCKVHLREEELPEGTLIVRCSKHITCVIDGVIHDTYDCSRDGNRCVYGYWIKE